MQEGLAGAGARCGACGRFLQTGYRLRGGDIRCGRDVLLYGALLRRSLMTGLIVGTILTGINHGDEIVRGAITTELAWKIGLTYCVPFCVSTSGALGAARARFA